MIFNMQRGGMISNMRDKEGVRSQCIVVERELALATLATHRWRNCKTVALFPQTIAEQSNNCTAVKQLHSSLFLARDATWTETESWTTRSSER